jgi:hypothetical protein
MRQINMQGKITGWGTLQCRASKVKLGLVNDPFDSVSFESSMFQSWADDDHQLIVN